jgi:hypothetical protein
MLDAVLFGVLKKHATGLTQLREEHTPAAFIIKVYHHFKQMTIEGNVCEAFRATGFACHINQIPAGLFFDKEKFRQSPGFVELREHDIPLENLSRQQREARLG